MSFYFTVMLIIACGVYVATARDPVAGKCVLESVSDTIGMVSVSIGVHGQCKNLGEIKGFKRCRGYCHSVDAWSKQAQKLEQTCECCRAETITHVLAELTCEDDMTVHYNVSTPEQCSCRPCGDTWTPKDKKSLDIRNIPY